MVLRGVLDVSFNNYVCIRGFAPLKDLAKHSKIDLKYQRQPDDKHVQEIAAFIKQKAYHYYPEILLGMPCGRFKYIEKTRKMVDKAISGGFKHYMEVVSREISLYDALRNMVLGDMSPHHDNVESLDLGSMKPRHESDPAKCRFYGRHFGALKVSVGQRKNYLDRNERVCQGKGEDVQYLFLNVSIYDIEKVEGGSPIYCIDGNHRLEVARKDENVGNYLVPFCLMLFEDEDSCREHGAMLFHNINYHALHVSDERNALTIVKHKKASGEYLFSDERLLSFPSLGRGEYYFVRKTWDALRMEYEKNYHGPDECRVSELFDSALFKEIFSENVDEQSVGALTFLLNIYKALFDQIEKSDKEISKDITNLFKNRVKHDQSGYEPSLSEDYKNCTDEFVKNFVSSLHKADKLVCERDDLKRENQNAAIAAALVALAFYEDKRFQSYFLDYVVKRRWGCVKDLSVPEVMSLFEEQMDRKKRTIFVSMPFHKYACDYHYQVIEEVVNEINSNYQKELGDVLLGCHKVDRNETGKTFEINQKVADSIAECGLLIADLTYSNVNVFHEVGMLMGRAFAQQGHTNEFDMILLCDESESSVNDVEYNIHSLQMVCFKQPAELKDQLRDRLLNFYKLEPKSNRCSNKPKGDGCGREGLHRQ